MRNQVVQGTTWLTAAEVAERARVPLTQVHVWRAQREIFAVSVHGVDLYPAYTLARDGRPWAAISAVIAALPAWKPERLASWFEAKSSTLGGERPRDLIFLQPERVIDAATRVANAEAHDG